MRLWHWPTAPCSRWAWEVARLGGGRVAPWNSRSGRAPLSVSIVRRVDGLYPGHLTVVTVTVRHDGSRNSGTRGFYISNVQLKRATSAACYAPVDRDELNGVFRVNPRHPLHEYAKDH